MKCYSVTDLKQVQRDLTVPFELRLPLSDSNGSNPATERWYCETILRWLPGKRLVLRLRRGERQQLAKLFFTRKDLQRELRGHRALTRNGITTAALDEQRALDRQTQMIFYQWLDADTLERLNDAVPLRVDAPALQHCVATVARMHRQGLRQIDIHPGNFLYRGGTIWVVDCAAIRQHRKPLGARRARENLADLLAQFPPAQIDDLTPLWQSYCQQWPSPNWRLDELLPAIEKMRALRWRHYRGKLTRACSEFVCTQSHRRLQVWTRADDGEALRSTLANPDAQMAAGQALKRGNTATVSAATIAGRATIIKRYNIKNWRHRLSRCWRPSRAWRSWHNAHFLRFNGIVTPRPIALVEERYGPLRGGAYFFCEQVRGDDLKTHLSGASTNERQAMLANLGRIITQYWHAGISHGDMKADNFIVSSEGLTVIDLDPMAHHHNQDALQRALGKDVARFLANFDGELRASIALELTTHLPAELAQTICGPEAPQRIK